MDLPNETCRRMVVPGDGGGQVVHGERASADMLVERIRGWIDGEQRSTTLPAREPVSAGRIRLWTSVMNADDTPVPAEATAPRAMLPTWTLPQFSHGASGTARAPMFLTAPFRALDEAGYRSIVATDLRLAFEADAEIGETVTETFTVTSISDEKTTALGAGFFLDVHSDFRSGDRALGMAVTRVFKFAQPAARPERPGRPAVATSPESGPGALAATEIAVTATLIASGAVATSDFQYSHFDPARAREAGTPDIIMSIHTLTGLLASYALRRTGPGVTLAALDVRLGLPVHPGGVLIVAGETAEADPRGDAYALRVTSDRGLHADGRAVMRRD